MKIKIKKSKLKKHLENISRGLQSYSVLPILEGILITVSQSNIQMLVSDGNLSIKEIIDNSGDIEISEPGQILVPGKLFKDIISKQSENIELSIENEKMIITSEGSQTELNLFNPSDYPMISFDTFGKDLVIDTEVLRNIIRDVSFAAAIEDRRIILNGVNLKASEGIITASATNSFRLARESKKINSTVEFDITVLAKKLKDFLPSDAKGEITINVDDVKMISRINTTTISTRLIDGIYPPIEKLITKEFKSLLRIEIKELESLLDKVTVISNQGKKIVIFRINNNKLRVESKRSEIGVSVAETNNITFDGEEIDIAFDASYLKEAISKFDKEIFIGFNGPQKPFIIYSDVKEELIQIILPHRSF